MAQGIAIVAVLVAGSHLKNALSQHIVQGVPDISRMAQINQRGSQALSQADLLINTA